MTFDPSTLGQRLSPRQFLWACRLYRPIRSTGVKIKSLSTDWLRWELELPLSRRTRNYVGTHFGGTLYSAMDPFLILSFKRLVDAVVWDKAATVRFKRPGRGRLFMAIHLAPDEPAAIQTALETKTKLERTYLLEWRDKSGVVVAEIEKILHFHRSNS